jgi:hypothetical protein
MTTEHQNKLIDMSLSEQLEHDRKRRALELEEQQALTDLARLRVSAKSRKLAAATVRSTNDLKVALTRIHRIENPMRSDDVRLRVTISFKPKETTDCPAYLKLDGALRSGKEIPIGEFLEMIGAK